MANNKQDKTILRPGEPAMYQLEPAKIMMYLTLAGITVLFLCLTVSYMASKTTWTWTQFRFPRSFLLSALLLGLSSFTIHKAVIAFKDNATQTLVKMLGATLSLSILFIVFQVIGWQYLYERGIYVGGKPDGSYLYLISGLHALHVIVGVLILAWVFFKAITKLKGSVNDLVYFSEKSNQRSLELIALYWHFVDVLWIYLLLFFLFNHW